jgi:peptidoglycan/xylan/chitin deacetylase (PgdA/CDA1 family)
MEWLKRATRVVSLADAVGANDPVGTACAGRPSGDLQTCVTFDDAFDNVRRNAAPILAELALPATVFAVSGNLGRPPAWEMPGGHADAGETIMTPEALRDLPDSLIEVGSHTMSHVNLTSCTSSELRREVTESKRGLEEVVGHPIRFFSVPFGAYTADAIRIARDAGYHAVVTSDPLPVGTERDPFCLGRFAVSPDDWMVEFKLKAAGAYAWRGRVWRWQGRIPTTDRRKDPGDVRSGPRVKEIA